ncbi:MAG: hypothetical protein CO141_03780 [Candidatus Moranbacteria bacterium CG_4_9_14_3_um_filter_42_9]|nr:MAG: hypothetical protein CO141_03780 [Candidatus Moranbacteria bacterium CG_4_9_14_3_um_filter_42_9]
MILASPRQEFAPARAGAAVSFYPLSFLQKKVDNNFRKKGFPIFDLRAEILYNGRVIYFLIMNSVRYKTGLKNCG